MHILVVRNNSNAKAIDASLLLAAYLGSQGIECTIVDSPDLAELEDGVDMAVALGGDGTILRTVRCTHRFRTPVLGINFGRLGFLANASDEGVVAVVAAALAGDVVEERRANLSIDVVLEGGRDPWEDDEGERDERADDEAARTEALFALNEVAVTRGANGRIIDFSLDISGAPLADMRGDGLVVATATGSTAYALSAGGPLVAPSFGGLVVVPVAPHTLRARALVTAENDVVRMSLSPDAAADEASLFIDGELVTFDRPIRRVYVRRGAEPTILLRYRGEGFYEHAARVFF